MVELTYFLSTERVLHAIFGCRVVLDLREQMSNGALVYAAPASASLMRTGSPDVGSVLPIALQSKEVCRV